MMDLLMQSGLPACMLQSFASNTISGVLLWSRSLREVG